MEKKLLIQDIAEAIAAKGGISKKDASNFVRTLFEVIEQALLDDKFIKIKGFGTFKIINVNERESVNINTGERFFISGHAKVSFTPDNQLKDLVNRPFAHFETVIINDEACLEEFENMDELPEGAEEDEDGVDENLTGFDEDAEDNDADTADDNDKDDVYSKGEALDAAEATTALHTTETLTDLPIPTPIDFNQMESAAVPTKELPMGNDKEGNGVTETIIVQPVNPEHATDVLPIKDAVANPVTVDTQTEIPDTGHCISNHHEPADNAYETENMTSDNNQNEKLQNPVPVCEETAAAAAETDREKLRQEDNEQTDNPDRPLPKQPAATENNSSQDVTSNTDGDAKHIEYILKENYRRPFNVWKLVSIALFGVLLLLLSYFAGYFKWFCPCENESSNPTNKSVQLNELQCALPVVTDSLSAPQDSLPTDSVRQMTKNDGDSIPTATSIKTADKDMQRNAAATATTVMKNQTPVAPATEDEKDKKKVKVKDKDQKDVKDKKPVKQEKAPKRTTSPSKQKTEKQYAQLPGGKYSIVGTLQNYKVKSGESIRTIALKIYGSKGFAPYIVTHNNIQNPDLISADTVLQLPKLEKKP